MTAPYYPPPKSLDGRSARELVSYERTVDDGEEVPPPGRLPDPPTVALPIADGPDVTVLTEQPATEIAPWPAQRPYYDASAQTEVRAVGDNETAGAAEAVVYPVYSTDPEEPSSWASPCAGLGETGLARADVPLGEVGTHRSPWFPLLTAARADVAWSARALNGDGIETPVVGKFHIQFRQAPQERFVRRYWRTTAPSVDAPDVLAVGALGDFWSCVPALSTAAWLTPNAAAIAASYGSLLLTKGNAETTVIPTSTDAHTNVSGPVLMFVTPPLLAQPFNNIRYRVMFKGQAPGGNTAGYAAPRLAVWRESEAAYVAYGPPVWPGPLWFRFIARARVAESVFVAYDDLDTSIANPIPDFAVEEDDRVVMMVGAGLATGCGGLQTTENYGAWLSYNGSYDRYDGTELVEFDVVGGTASYLDLPASVRFKSDTEI